jgi:hypothetical protein
MGKAGGTIVSFMTFSLLLRLQKQAPPAPYSESREGLKDNSLRLRGKIVISYF